MPTKNHRTDTAVIHQRALILCDTGELIKQPVPVHFFSWQVLGALIVIEDEGLIRHELVLIRDRLNGIDDPSILLGTEAPRVDGPEGMAGLLEGRLRHLVERTIAEARLDDQGVYFIILGDPLRGP